MPSGVTLEFIARRRSIRHFRDRRTAGRLFACDLYRVVADGGGRRAELVCELACFDRDRAADLNARAKFWEEVSAALAPHIRDISDDVMGRLRDQLGRWVPAPTRDEVARLEERERERRDARSNLPTFRPRKKM